jgi:hypothetical protein
MLLSRVIFAPLASYCFKESMKDHRLYMKRYRRAKLKAENDFDFLKIIKTLRLHKT